MLVSEAVELAGVKPSTDDAGLILTGVHDQSAQPLSEDAVCPFVLFGQPYLLLPIELLSVQVLSSAPAPHTHRRP
jgi:hypothetical protein